MSVRHVFLSVLLFPDPYDRAVWIAQALEKDIAATGEGIEQAKRALERTVAGYFALAEKHNQEPLASLRPAPELFWNVWERVVHQRVEAERIPSVPAFMLAAVSHDSVQTR